MTEPGGAFDVAAARVRPLDGPAMAAAAARQRQLTKPLGSLGRLEELGAQLAGIAGECPPPLPRPAAVAVFAGDHGVHARGVTPWPQIVTAQMVGNLCGGGAAVNVLADRAGVDAVVVDVGVASPVADHPRLRRHRVVDGTADLSAGPALSEGECRAALDAGALVADELIEAGMRCLLTGDMGIANTTATAALIAGLTGHPAAEVTGRGTGIDDAMLVRKTEIVAAAAARTRGLGPLETLAEVGGAEHAGLVGFLVASAARGIPVIVDGAITQAALLVAVRLVPPVIDYVVVSHRSVEPGSAAVLDALGVRPVLDLDLRLGEGTGAVLALPIVDAAAAVLRSMASFDDAGVAES